MALCVRVLRIIQVTHVKHLPIFVPLTLVRVEEHVRYHNHYTLFNPYIFNVIN